MEKKPIFGRLILVGVVGVVFFFQWYPPQGQDLVEAFKARTNSKADTVALFQRLDQAKAGLGPNESLSLKAWSKAIGETMDLREVMAESFLLTIFPHLIGGQDGKDGDEDQKKRAEKLKIAALRELGLSPEAWDSETPSTDTIEIINRTILKKIEAEASGKIQLGLDLSGGIAFAAQLKPKEGASSKAITKEELNQAIEVIRERIDVKGVKEPLIQALGSDSIIIQIPALSQEERDAIRNSITNICTVEFRLSHPENKSPDRSDRFIPGAERMIDKTEDKNGQIFTTPYFIEAKTALSGKHVKSATVRRNPVSNKPEIHFTLDAIGANKFAKITDRHKVGEQDARLLAVVRVDVNADGEKMKKLICAPSINGRIHARGQITGIDSMKESHEIAASLNNPMENPLQILEEREVDPSLGRDSVVKGYRAAIWGLVAVAIFMLIYYLLTGVVANIALALNIVLLLGVMCWFDATLTLPGIAGIVLTIGMAVDANVLIYERIREELNVGKSLRGAIASGYDKAFGTIFDANITTMIASIILIYMGKGPVKGFGVTLTIGILVSMFTALVVTRLVMDMLLKAGVIGGEKSKRLMHLRPSVNLSKINFLKYALPAFIASWGLIIVGFGAGLLKGSDKMLGVDFAGGYSMLLDFNASSSSNINSDIESGSFREKLSLATGIDGAQIQPQLQTDLSTRAQKLRIDFPLGANGADNAGKVKEHVKRLYSDASPVQKKLEMVGPSISGEIQKSALIAVMLALFGILIYVAFRYEYSFAFGAVIAILHDVLMTGGLFFLSGRELNAPIVAAALTIIGFSINDTIVIFDRIRENLRMGTRGSFADVMNTSLNQTLSRTIITSGTTLLSTATLYFFGGTVINDFAFTFLVGVITGTYSSIYIACAIVLWWHRGKRPELAAPAVDTEPVGAAITT
jgi:SecD/SecF fusion protein